MKRLLFLFFAFLIVLNGCGDEIHFWDSEETRRAKRAEQELERKEGEDELRKMMVTATIFRNAGAIPLLSQKYAIDRKSLLDMLWEYNDYYFQYLAEFGFVSYAAAKDKDHSEWEALFESHFKFFDAISKKYNIPKEKLAALLIDFKILSQDSE